MDEAAHKAATTEQLENCMRLSPKDSPRYAAAKAELAERLRKKSETDRKSSATPSGHG